MKRILLLFLMLVSTPFFGQTYQTWRTEATDNIWQTNNNWWNFPNGSPIVFGQQEWDNNHQLTQQSNADVNTWRFLYKSGASSTHTFTGNKIRFFDFSGQNPSIINDSSVNQIINNNIEGDGDVADPLEIRVNNGNLTFNGTMNNMGSWIDIYGVNGKSVAFTGAISGSAGLTVKENSTVTLSNANNTYSGSTSVDAGTLIVQKGGHSASITTGAIAFTFASSNQAAGIYDFLPGQLGGNTSRTLTSNLVGGKTISFNYATGDVTICDVMTVTTASIASNNANSSSLAKSGDVITLSFTTSEAASVTPSVSINGNAATVSGSGTTWSATKTVVGGDVNGVVTFSISFQNAFGCTGTRNTVTNGSSVTIDTTAPTVPSAFIASNNVNSSSYAKTGDIITLSFTTSEAPAVTPSVTINGNAATVSGGGTAWSATKTVVGGDTNGNVTFSIVISDTAGNMATRTSTTNSSSVTIDNLAPVFTAVSIASNNAGSSSIAVPGDNITLTFSTSESVTTPSVVLNGASATVSGSGTNWSATTTVLTCSGSVVSFSISVSDITGNTANNTSTTNGSQVTISAQVGTPSFTAGATLVCQDAANETYTATASNATGGVFYSVDPEEAGVINDVTGVMNWDAAFSGVATITAYAFGCNGPTTSDRIVTVQSKYLFYVDADGDGYGSSTSSMVCSSSALVAPTGFSTNNTDCNDALASINPGATEINFNNIDEDCDSSIFNGHAPVVSNISTPSGALAAMTSTITCTQATNTSPYSGTSVVHRFKVTRTAPTSAVEYINSATRTFSISQLAIAAHSATYAVQATAIVNGEEQPYNGNTATFTTPAAPVIVLTSQVVPTQCNQNLSRIDSYVYADNSTTFSSGQRYEFVVTRLVNGVPTPSASETVSTTVPYFRLISLTTLPITYGTTYRVKVRYGYVSYGSNVWSNFSTECNVTTPGLVVTQVKANQCGATLPSINSFVYADGRGSANTYEFKVTRIVAPGDPVPAVTEETISRIVPYFKLTMLSSLQIGLEKEYAISVRYRFNSYGTEQWSDWGSTCSVFTPEFPTTGVTDGQCSLLDFTPQMNQYIYADAVTSATKYRFRLELFDELSTTPEVPVYSQYVDSVNKYITLSQFTGLMPSTTYVITVAVEMYGEFGPYGKDCSVTTPAFNSKATPVAVAETFDATAYPNPYTNNFMIDVKTSSQSVVTVKVFDMVGRLVEERKANVSDLENVAIGDRYPSGVYNVVITQDDEVKTLRVIKR